MRCYYTVLIGFVLCCSKDAIRSGLHRNNQAVTLAWKSDPIKLTRTQGVTNKEHGRSRVRKLKMGAVRSCGDSGESHKHKDSSAVL